MIRAFGIAFGVIIGAGLGLIVIAYVARLIWPGERND